MAPSQVPPDTPATISLPPVPTPTHGSKGYFSVACSAHISASPQTCLDVVLNSAEYPKWNRFCRSCVIEGTAVTPPSTPPSPTASASSSTNTSTPAQSENENGGSSGDTRKQKASLALGSKFVFDVHLDPETADSAGRATPLEVSVLELIDETNSPNTSNAPGDKGKGRATADDEASMGQSRRGWRVAWKTRGLMPSWMLRSERVQEFVEVRTLFGGSEETETIYVCWETFYGALAPLVRAAVGLKLVRGFQVWMDDLRKRAEEIERKFGHYASLSREAETKLKVVPEENRLEL